VHNMLTFVCKCLHPWCTSIHPSTIPNLFRLLHIRSLWPDRTKPTIRHLRHIFSSLDWNRNVTTILNAKGASAKVSDGGFCQIGSHYGNGHICAEMAHTPACMITLITMLWLPYSVFVKNFEVIDWKSFTRIFARHFNVCVQKLLFLASITPLIIMPLTFHVE